MSSMTDAGEGVVLDVIPFETSPLATCRACGNAHPRCREGVGTRTLGLEGRVGTRTLGVERGVGPHTLGVARSVGTHTLDLEGRVDTHTLAQE